MITNHQCQCPPILYASVMNRGVFPSNSLPGVALDKSPEESVLLPNGRGLERLYSDSAVGPVRSDGMPVDWPPAEPAASLSLRVPPVAADPSRMTPWFRLREPKSAPDDKACSSSTCGAR